VEKKPVAADVVPASEAVNNDEQLPLVSGARSMVQNNSWGDDDAGLKSMASAKAAAPMSDLKKKLLGAILACVAGLCYGFNMAPVIYLSQKYPCAGPFAFAFSHFSGIFLTSTAIMAVYAMLKKNQPYIERRSVLGGLGGGCLWGLAQCAWFAANVNLGPAIAFPIITTGGGIFSFFSCLFVF
jgi:drug/metabolite transporter (DMT)-like permease